MPELPEVETSLRGIRPHLVRHVCRGVVVRTGKLRWPVPPDLGAKITGAVLREISRRGKYLLFEFDSGTLLLHLGMSGSLRILPTATAAGRHDHVDFIFDDQLLRLTDPRKFGTVLWIEGPPGKHPLLANLGVEPLSADLTAEYLLDRANGRRVDVKQFIMDQKVVVGVGNIYANEALFRSGIRPDRQAGSISLPRYRRLVAAIRDVLEAAIAQGGTTLQDFAGSDGRPGYFARQLQVYGKTDAGCPRCGGPIRQVRIGQRSTYFCRRCQT